MRTRQFSQVTILLGALLAAACQRGSSRASEVAPPHAVSTSSAACVAPEPGQADIPFEAGRLVPICRNVFAEAATTEAERASLRAAYVEAAADVVRILGPRRSELPRTLFCKTDACRRYVGGPSFRSRALDSGATAPGASYVATGPTLLVLRTDGGARGVTAHEMVHVEAHARLDGALLPEWFHEGLAAVVSGAPDCSDAPPRGVDDLRRLDSHAAWNAHTDVVQQQHPTYCQARAEVASWLAVHGGGSDALGSLLEVVRSGASFYDAYGRLRNCETNCAGPLGTVSPARLRFYPLDENRGATAADASHDATHPALLAGKASWSEGHRGAAVSFAKEGGFLRTDAIDGIGVVDQPFSLELWVKPSENHGVLVHASVKPGGGDGWCVPLLGFDASGHLVGQVLFQMRDTAFLTAVGPELPHDTWSRVTMTWNPTNGVRLFVNGALAGVGAPSSRVEEHWAAPGGRPVHLTYGSDQGAACWRGSIPGGDFSGALDELAVYNYERDPTP